MIEIADSEIVPAPGAYRMSATAYHSDPCPQPSLSSSIAKLLLDASPAHAFTAHPRLNAKFKDDEGSPRLALGAACHALLIGRGAKLACIPFDDYKTKDARAMRDAAMERGEIPIIEKQLGVAMEIAAAAREQLPAAIMKKDGDGEVTIAAEFDGIWCRSMLDWWSRDRRDVVDYKTTTALATPNAFAMQAARLGYDVQDAFYQRVLTRAFPELAGRLRFVFVVQEIEPPYALSVMEISEADRHVADRKVDAAMDRWRACIESGRWPSYQTGIQRVVLPEWHHKRWLEEELNDGGQTDRPGDWAFAGGMR